MREALKTVKKTAQDRWKDRWTNGTTGAHLRALIPAPNKDVRKLYAKRRKAAGSLLVQLRTGKIGFNDFLHSRGVPQVRSRRCACGMGDMTVRHVILVCQNWANERKTYLDRADRDLKRILNTPEKATAAIRMILATEILAQFRAVDARTVEG